MFNPPEVVYLTELTIAQASFLGEWMAAQFAPYGVGVALHCGHSYKADPEAFKLFFTAANLRVCASGGIIMTTPDLKACCHLFTPGKAELRDLPEGSPALEAWQRFCNRVGGEAAVLERRIPLAKISDAKAAVYGKDGNKNYRYGAFAVHKDLQGTGIGRYFHELNLRRASEAGCLLTWAAARNNYGFYEKCGSERIGDEVHFGAELPTGYPDEGIFVSLMQSAAHCAA